MEEVLPGEEKYTLAFTSLMTEIEPLRHQLEWKTWHNVCHISCVTYIRVITSHIRIIKSFVDSWNVYKKYCISLSLCLLWGMLIHIAFSIPCLGVQVSKNWKAIDILKE